MDRRIGDSGPLETGSRAVAGARGTNAGRVARQLGGPGTTGRAGAGAYRRCDRKPACRESRGAQLTALTPQGRFRAGPGGEPGPARVGAPGGRRERHTYASAAV